MNFIEMESEQKLRGGYYTPPDIAAFLLRWVKEIRPSRLLEPSCGNGVFIEALAEVKGFRNTIVTAFELNREEAIKASASAHRVGFSRASVYPEDFLGWAIDQIAAGGARFDAVVGNPPFVRYQYLPAPFQICAEQIFCKLDLPFTKHTNAWVSFVLASIALLRPGGRLAMVVPAEIMHVTHAQSLRSFLGREARRIVIIDPERLWFSDTLQGVVILLVEKKRFKSDSSEGLGMYPVKDREFLRVDPAIVYNTPQTINGKTMSGKWTRALLDSETRNLFDELAEYRDVHAFNDIAQVDVGIVTGANKFFLVSDKIVQGFKLSKWAHPMFGRSEHCPGVIYDEQQHAANAAKGNPTNFLWFRGSGAEIDEAAWAYIKMGESQKLHTRYKCSVRSPWFTVPSVYSTEIGMLKRSHDTPRLILNRIGAYTTDTAYRIRTKSTTPEVLVGCFINPLTALSAELESRHYGGGVLELIPSEIERLTIPLPQAICVDIAQLDADIRRLPAHQVLSRQGRIILGKLGLANNKQDCLLEGWRKLRDRRQRTSSEPLFDED